MGIALKLPWKAKRLVIGGFKFEGEGIFRGVGLKRFKTGVARETLGIHGSFPK